MAEPTAPPELVLALSPLLPPLRFVARTNLTKLNTLREFEPLVLRALAQARPVAGSNRPQIQQIAEAIAGFDRAPDAERRAALVQVIRILGEIVSLPNEVTAVCTQGTLPIGPAQPDLSKLPNLPNSQIGTTPQRKTAKPAPNRAVSAAPALPTKILPGAPPQAAAVRDPLLTPVALLKGVGPAISQRLQLKGLETVGDLLLNLPRRYEDRRHPRTIAEAPLGERSMIAATVVTANEARGRKRRLEVRFRDDAGDTLLALWFHFRFDLFKKFVPGARVLLGGEVKAGFRGGGKTMTHPDVEMLSAGGGEQIPLGEQLGKGADDSFGGIVPIYTEIEGVPPRSYRRIVRRALDEFAPALRDLLPAGMLAKRNLLSLREAISETHFPEAFSEEAALGRSPGEPRRRLAFEELFLVQLGLALKRRGTRIEPGIAFRATDESIARITQALPWPLTGAQQRSVQQIAKDMRSPEPMNRLLQGDVGSGKTAVALSAARLAIEDGYQAALMAPTEILAEQHHRSLAAMLKGTGIHVELLTGSLGAKERNFAERIVRTGTAQLVVGTHALAEEATQFHKLGIVIIDEQHRFGVLTRQRLMTKGARPDTLVMTATPIPRTLALTLYGDLDVSVLDELPPGRTPIATKVFKDAQREKAYEVVRRELAAGHQAYVVLPLVEESEKLVELKAATIERDRLAADVFQGVPIGLVHGRQSSEERAAAMERFRSGKDKILVATTVIEVGVDVPNASVMMIEHAERFGLSQLHQLRGRVGRGAAKSYCLLITGASGAEFGASAKQRMKVMEDTTDGFKISEADLELRGPGEFLGTRQSGIPDFAVAELARDQKILAEAREEAFALIELDPTLSLALHQELRRHLHERWRGRLSLARVG
jgi:ATP-dependent DNA helicase RecG